MELAIILGNGKRFKDSLDERSIPEIINIFLDGRFEAVLCTDAAKQFLSAQSKPDGQQDTESSIVNSVENYLSVKNDDESSSRELDVLVAGASCLQLFVQNNWLGPTTESSPAQLMPQLFIDDKSAQESALSFLSENGEPAYGLSRFAGFLHLAKVILLKCRHLVTSSQTWSWWLARCLSVQQALLDQRSPNLRDGILEALQEISEKESLVHEDSIRDVAVLFHVEASRMCQVYWEDKMARDHITQAQKLAGLHVELAGALGKRTRFQQEHKAQLVVKVTRDQEEQTLLPLYPNAGRDAPVLPKNLALGDDTVLDKIDFKDEEANAPIQLLPLEQALLFGLMDSHRRALAQERLTDEEVMTYLEFIISQVSSWTVSVSALAMRSRMECTNRRRVERSMLQLEDLVNGIGTLEPDVAARLQLFYAARPPTSWALQSELATVHLSLGLTGAALDIYERLQLYEEVINCYKQMGKREKAESVIREQLAIKETPTLLCLLGDVTRDKTLYQRAWELSNQRSARAMRCLAYCYFQEENFEESVNCFEKSLTINSLQVPVWFTCGCACLSAEKYEQAVRAFKRCLNIDYDNFEAWNNLATAYARLKKIRMAFLTMKDAIKCNYEKWQLWENCMLFATGCGEFEEVIHAYHRLMDIKEKWVDTEVLRMVVNAVVTGMDDAGGNSAARLLPRMLELFGRITSKVTSDAEVWQLYAELCRTKTPNHEPDLEKSAQFLQKSYKCATQKPGWEKDSEVCEKIIKQSMELAKANQDCAEKTETPQPALQLLTSTKLMLRGVVTKVRQCHTDPMTKELSEPLNGLCLSVDQQLQAVTDKVEQLRAT